MDPMQKLLQSLSEADLRLVRAAESKQLAGLDEDDLIELHARVRRARNKHVSNYRRAGATKVARKGSRGTARKFNERNAARAEILEGALGRVSRQLGIVAKQSARELKEERLSRARADAVAGEPTSKETGKVASARRTRVDETRKSPGRKKREAGSIAAGARRQAKRDSR
jgi:hypothetical protein